MTGSKISTDQEKYFQERVFCGFFYVLGIKEDYKKVGIGLLDGRQNYVLSSGWSALEERVWQEAFKGGLN